MRVVIVGAGISGLLSAYYLLQKGFDVHVMESNHEVASKASGANAAQLSYSYVNPIGSPSLLNMLPDIMNGKVEGVKFMRHDFETLLWGVKLLLQSGEKSFERNRSALLNHSMNSRKLFHQLIERTDIKLKYYSKGKMQLLHTELLLKNTKDFIQELGAKGIHQLLLQEDGAKHLLGEFSLDQDQQYITYSDIDESADCVDFCYRLVEYMKLNDKFSIQFGASVKEWVKNKLEVSIVDNNDQTHHADAILLCTGAKTNQLVKSIGLKFPIYPVKGYTLVYPYKTGLECSITDHKLKLVFVPQGDQLLVSGMFHIGGDDISVDESTVDYIHQSACKRIAELASLKYDIRLGQRPCTPNSLPIVSHTKYKNLFINSGHGMYGWTLAPSCANEVASLIAKSLSL